MLRVPRPLRRFALRRGYSTSQRFAPTKSLEYDVKHGVRGFDANEPVVVTKSFRTIPAIEKWFKPLSEENSSYELDTTYLEKYGDSIVPLELTRTSPDNSTAFERFEAPFS